VVGRSEDDDCVGVEEIDSLQMELEILLASAAKRMRHIHTELTLLDEWIEKGSVTPATTGKDKAIAAAGAASSSQQVIVIIFSTYHTRLVLKIQGAPCMTTSLFLTCFNTVTNTDSHIIMFPVPAISHLNIIN